MESFGEGEEYGKFERRKDGKMESWGIYDFLPTHDIINSLKFLNIESKAYLSHSLKRKA